MAGGIKGITIEIGGDTTKLGKAIGDTEKKSRSLQNELRQVEKLLKFDPTNVELLSQKQKILTDNVSETSKKLDLLKEAEKQVTEQFKRGEASEEQVRALQREIIKTEGVLGSMKSELNSTNKALKNLADGTDNAEKQTREYAESVEKAKKELEDFKGKASGAFDTIKTGATVAGGAIVATAGYALKLSTDFDKASNILITKTGATTDEIDELNTAMENVYANNFGESIEDVANSMAIVKTNTKLTGEELERTTEYALLLRDTFDFEVNESTRSAKMLMYQFGLSAEDAYNLIAQGAQNGLDKNGDLLDTVNEYSVHFKQLGIDAPTMFNMLVNGANSGTFSVDKLGDAVKEFGIRVKDGSDATAEGFSLIGLNADEMSKKFGEGGESAKQALLETAEALFALDDPIAQNQAGVALFGTMWEDLGVEGVQALMTLDGKVSESADALGQINEHRYDDIGSALQGLGRTIETDVIQPLGEELKPVVEDAIDYVKENGPQIKDILSNVVKKVGEFVGFIVNNGPTILSVLAGIGAGFVAFKVASLISGVVEAMKAFKLANEGATLSQTLLNAVMNANPLILIATLVAGLIVAIVSFIATNDEARAKFMAIWEPIAEFFSNLWSKITSSLKPVADSITGAFKQAWELIKVVWNLVSPYFETIWNNIKAVFSVVKTYFEGLFRTAWEAIKAVWNAVTGYFKAIWDTIAGIFSVVKDVLTGNWSDAWESIKGIIDTWKDYFSGIWDSIKNVFGSVKTWFSDTFSSAWTAVKNVFSNWGEFFGGLWTTIKDKFTTIGTSISNAISDSVKSGLNGVITAIENIINGGINLINGAIDLINKIPNVSVGKLDTLSLPRLARGGIVDGPTIAEIGEDGAEAIVPLENNTEWIDNVANKLNRRLDGTLGNDTALFDKLDRIYERLGRLQMVLDSGTLIGELLDGIDAGLGDKQLLQTRGI